MISTVFIGEQICTNVHTYRRWVSQTMSVSRIKCVCARVCVYMWKEMRARSLAPNEWSLLLLLLLLWLSLPSLYIVWQYHNVCSWWNEMPSRIATCWVAIGRSKVREFRDCVTNFENFVTRSSIESRTTWIKVNKFMFMFRYDFPIYLFLSNSIIFLPYGGMKHWHYFGHHTHIKSIVCVVGA